MFQKQARETIAPFVALNESRAFVNRTIPYRNISDFKCVALLW